MSKEDFNDVQELRTKSLGVLGGEGADFLEKVTTQTTPAGIESKAPCGQCGRPQIITVEWPEAVVGSLSLMPPNWEYDQQSASIYPNVGCASCRYQMKLLFTPQELKRLVKQAIDQGEVNPQVIHSLYQQAQAAAPRR
jgi:hypothetical protein